MNKTKYLLIASATLLIIIVGFFLGKNASESVSDQGSDTYEVVGENIVIDKSAITSTASFIPYKLADNYMEVIAIKASDGSIRTALNTCQVCFDSGRGYYDQSGDTLICNNCRNVFGTDDIEVIRGGCNPIPVTSTAKTENDETITISGQFLKDNSFYFARWEK